MYLKNEPILASVFFIFFFSTVHIKFVQYKYLPVTGLEPRIFGIGSNHSTNWATTTDNYHMCIWAHHIRLVAISMIDQFFFRWAIPRLFLMYFRLQKSNVKNIYPVSGTRFRTHGHKSPSITIRSRRPPDNHHYFYFKILSPLWTTGNLVEMILDQLVQTSQVSKLIWVEIGQNEWQFLATISMIF